MQTPAVFEHSDDIQDIVGSYCQGATFPCYCTVINNVVMSDRLYFDAGH